jgi:hypothetical protein
MDHTFALSIEGGFVSLVCPDTRLLEHKMGTCGDADGESIAAIRCFDAFTACSGWLLGRSDSDCTPLVDLVGADLCLCTCGSLTALPL